MCNQPPISRILSEIRYFSHFYSDFCRGSVRIRTPQITQVDIAVQIFVGGCKNTWVTEKLPTEYRLKKQDKQWGRAVDE